MCAHGGIPFKRKTGSRLGLWSPDVMVLQGEWSCLASWKQVFGSWGSMAVVYSCQKSTVNKPIAFNSNSPLETSYSGTLFKGLAISGSAVCKLIGSVTNRISTEAAGATQLPKCKDTPSWDRLILPKLLVMLVCSTYIKNAEVFLAAVGIRMI